MTVMRGSEAVTQTMKSHGVELVVGLTGHSVQEFSDTLYDDKDIRTFHVRTEMSGGHLVNAYNKMKGRAAAAGVWHTCGSLVTPVAVYDALFDRVPSVHIAMNCHSYLKDRDAMQEIPMWVKLNDPDFVGLAKAFGGDGETVEDPRQLGDAIKRGVNSGTVYLIEAVINHTYGYPGTGFYSVRWDPVNQPSETLGLKFADNHGEK